MTIGSDIRIHIIDNPGSWMVDVFIVDKSIKPSLAHIVNGQLEFEEIITGAAPSEPTMRIHMDVWQSLKAALVENHERDKHVVESELQATKYHLEDMRKLALQKVL